jgi:xanthine/uracil permease
MAPGPDSGRWSSQVLAWALRLLAIAIVLRVAVYLFVSIAPVLIGIGVGMAVIYVLYAVNKVRRSRW